MEQRPTRADDLTGYLSVLRHEVDAVLTGERGQRTAADDKATDLDSLAESLVREDELKRQEAAEHFNTGLRELLGDITPKNHTKGPTLFVDLEDEFNRSVGENDL